ncbi:hypothetical protein CYY_010154 [Polysphondylium violaceum]|uniref:Uncharacterized protein n=1 Tax=Polysphondylium violaceum TaxID=133409 RepID=A0A8J4V264_9MYCE|nr:hypothetical protein CYY_010154 [Polysphondylium violaceum]
MSNFMLNNPDYMPRAIRGARIIGTATDAVKKFKEHHSRKGYNYNPYDDNTVNIEPTSAPMFMTTNWSKVNYQACNYSYIKLMEEQASADLNPIYDNIKKNGDAAWRQVSQDGQDYWMSWGPSGFVWTYTDPSSMNKIYTSNSDSDPKVQMVVQFGTYSQSAQIAGIHSYNLTTKTLLGESVIALIVAKCLSGFIADGLDFLVTAFASRLAAAALEIGLDLTFALPEFVLPLVATCIVFTVVFIGLSYLFDWLDRKYTIRLQMFNWDDKYEWDCVNQYMSNALIPGHDDGILRFNLPKMVQPGTVIVPPGFDITTLDSICYYAMVIWNNDFTFMQGCSFSVNMSRNYGKYDPYHVDDGFTWAFNCPRWSNNQQALQDGSMDPEQYLNRVKKNNEWDPYPLKNSKVVTNDNTLVNFSVDYLEGAKDNLYNVLININAPRPNGNPNL